MQDEHDHSLCPLPFTMCLLHVALILEYIRDTNKVGFAALIPKHNRGSCKSTHDTQPSSFIGMTMSEKTGKEEGI